MLGLLGVKKKDPGGMHLNHQFSESVGEVNGVQNPRVIRASEPNLLENGEGIHTDEGPLQQRGCGRLKNRTVTGGSRQCFRGEDRSFTKYWDLWHRIG